MDIRAQLFAKHHGLVRTGELSGIGIEDEWIRIAHNYGALIQVRQGWWALPATPEVLLQAWRAGGRLACVSALAFHGVTLELGEQLHIEVAAGSKGALQPDVCAHWSSSQGNGDRRAVSVEVALKQARCCRARLAPPR